MKRCRSEGELRAWLDRELTPLEMRQVADHLAECDECGRLRTELEARANLVGALMESLDTPAPVLAESRASRRWISFALAAAAALTLAIYLLPTQQGPYRSNVPARVTGRVAAKAIPGPHASPPVTRAVTHSVGHAASPHRRLRGHRAEVEGARAVAVDDEPIEAGFVYQFDVQANGVQADSFVFTPDGSTRTFRLASIPIRGDIQ
jgi:anti-sigma factor RsiW